MASTLELVREIEKLPLAERAEWVDLVLRDVLQPDAGIEAAWTEESSRRWQAYKNGGAGKRSLRNRDGEVPQTLNVALLLPRATGT